MVVGLPMMEVVMPVLLLLLLLQLRLTAVVGCWLLMPLAGEEI